MFIGQFRHTLDSKGRLTIPVQFRSALSSGVVITQGFEPNLIVYTTEDFRTLADRATALSTTHPAARAIRRKMFGEAHVGQLDSSGRILIPDFLRSYADLTDTAAIIGSGEYFEIWNEPNWEKEAAELKDTESSAMRFIDFDLSTG
jgi:MraZ protein